jgi:hypothetical protein
MEGCIDYAERACQFLVVDHLADYFEGRFGLHVDATVLPSAGEGHVEVAPIDALGHQKLALLAHRNPALADFSARLEPLAQLAGITCAADAMVGLAITNTGSVAWPAFGKRAVMVSYHWIDHSGNMVLFDGMRTNLPHDVRPGERIELRCLLRAPEARGRMMLVWTLVQEHVAWFNDRNRASQYSCEIEVV